MPDRSNRDFTPRQQGASCNCFAKQPSNPRSLEVWNIDYLHDRSRQLIGSWFERAWQNREADGENSFEPFIFAWFSVNAWAACVTGEDSDSKYMQRLIVDPSLAAKFEQLVATDQEFSDSALHFASCWPIFSVKDLRKRHRHLLGIETESRAETVKSYLADGATQFEPRCWTTHHEQGQPPPCDWPHTIAAIYQVRCNLFHGEKSAHSGIDQTIVQAAFRVLVYFFRKSDIM